jgi:AraC-like DNA-binding protein
LFGCVVEFGSPMDQVIFPLEAKELALPNADPYLNGLMQRYCENILSMRRIKAGDWRSKVANVIAPLLPHGEATIENVARRLGVSHRTLARR